VTPLIQIVATFNQHEGNVGKMVTADDSESIIDYRRQEFEFALNRDGMRRFDLPVIRKLTALAKEIGQAQTKRMLEVAGEAADSVGNVVHAGGELTPDKFLEVFRRVRWTLTPILLNRSQGLSG
jgi:hypothetical protein